MSQEMPFSVISNGQTIPLAQLPFLPFDGFRLEIIQSAAAFTMPK